MQGRNWLTEAGWVIAHTPQLRPCDGSGPVVLVGVALLHGHDLHWHDHELKFTILAFPEA